MPRIQEQIKELNKVITVLVMSKNKRIESGKHTAIELDYQIDCCKCAVNSLERLLKLKDQLKQALDLLKEFELDMTQ